MGKPSLTRSISLNHATNQELIDWRWGRAVPAGCLLMLIFGSSYALAVFSLPMADMSHALLSPFTSALGVQSFSIAITMLVGGYLIDSYPSALRIFIFIGLLITSSSTLWLAFGAQNLDPKAVFLSTSCMGFGLGTLYIGGVEHTAQWMPELEGLAMGLGMGSLGLGSIIGSKLFQLLIDVLGVFNAFIAMMAIMAISTLITLPFLKFPQRGWDPRAGTATISGSSSSSVDLAVGHKLGSKLLIQPSFYQLLMIVACGAGPGYGAMVSFPTIMHDTFGLTAQHISSLFAILNVISMCTRFGIGFTVDFLAFGKGYFWSGAKNMSIVVLLAQCAALILAPMFAASRNFAGFFGCITTLFMSFAASAVIAAVLSRQIFSPVNSAIVFGFAGGLCDGFTTMVFSILISTVEDNAQGTDIEPFHIYDTYYVYCLYASILGLVCALAITRCRAAYEIKSEQGNIIVSEVEFIPDEHRDKTVALSIAAPDVDEEEVPTGPRPISQPSSLSHHYSMMGGFSFKAQEFKGYRNQGGT